MTLGVYPDAVKIVGEYLLLATYPDGVSSLIYSHVVTGTTKRVFLEIDPKSFKNPSESLVVVRAGGRMHPSVPMDRARIEIRCYGGSDNPEAARDLALLVVPHMHRARSASCASGKLISAVQDGGGDVIWTPPGVRPFVPVYFSTQVRSN